MWLDFGLIPQFLFMENAHRSLSFTLYLKVWGWVVALVCFAVMVTGPAHSTQHRKWNTPNSHRASLAIEGFRCWCLPGIETSQSWLVPVNCPSFGQSLAFELLAQWWRVVYGPPSILLTGLCSDKVRGWSGDHRGMTLGINRITDILLEFLKIPLKSLLWWTRHFSVVETLFSSFVQFLQCPGLSLLKFLTCARQCGRCRV